VFVLCKHCIADEHSVASKTCHCCWRSPLPPACGLWAKENCVTKDKMRSFLVKRSWLFWWLCWLMSLVHVQSHKNGALCIALTASHLNNNCNNPCKPMAQHMRPLAAMEREGIKKLVHGAVLPQPRQNWPGRCRFSAESQFPLCWRCWQSHVTPTRCWVSSWGGQLNTQGWWLNPFI